MAVALRIVCVFTVFCGALAAPTVSYDQRQQGEFNLQVDLDDMAIVLLPGGSGLFDMRNAGKLHQIFGRRSGVNLRKKHPKPTPCAAATTTAAATTAAATTSTATTSTAYPETFVDSNPSSVADNRRPTSDVVTGPGVSVAGVDSENDYSNTVVTTNYGKNTADGDKYLIDDPYSVTPSTPDIVKTKAGPTETGAAASPAAADSVSETRFDGLKYTDAPDNDGAAVTATEVTATVVAAESADKRTDSSAAVSTPAVPEIAKAEAAPAVSEEKPSNAQTAEETAPGSEAAKLPPTDRKPGGSSSGEPAGVEATIVQSVPSIAEPEAVPHKSVGKTADTAKLTFADALKAAKEPAAADAVDATFPATEVAAATAPVASDVKPTSDAAAAEGSVADAAATGLPAHRNKIADPVVEMVAMKTVERPSVAEALKVAKRPAAVVETASTTGPPIVSVNFGEQPVEMVAMKTLETPSNAGPTAASATGSGITASTKPVEILEDRKSPGKVVADAVVSRSASKQPVENAMVAVKTMDSPATITTVKTVTSVKTVTKSSAPAKSIISSNSSTILRKVADRKPLPTVMLEIATSKIVY